MIYPNLELLAYRFQDSLLKKHDKDQLFIPDTNIYVFPQIWGNTSGGFSEPGCASGQGFMKEYTTVLINRRENAAMVCFGNRPAYFIKPLNRHFWADFHKQQMRSVKNTAIYNEPDEETEDGNDGE